MKLTNLVISGIAAALVSASAFAQQKIVIKGSDTLGAKMVPQMAEAYKAKNPGVVFEIAAEGSSQGVAAIIDGTADIGMSSRDVKAKEKEAAKSKGRNLKLTPVAFDGIAIIVNEKNPIEKLTLKQVEDIFTGTVKNWSAVGGPAGDISAYTRNTTSGTYKAFQELAMSDKDYGASTQKMAGNEQIAAEVAKNPNGVGYVGLAYIDKPGLKVVPVDGVKAAIDTVKDQSYPIARSLFLITNGDPTGEAKNFMDFVLSADGQKIVEQVHFVPIK
jgi:phosphate transport system substrate-binding protein